MSHRTQVTLEDEQYQRLLAQSARTGLPLAELVRRAVDRTYGSTTAAEILRALEESRGSWTHRDLDGAAYVDSLRRGLASRLAAS